MLAICKHGKLNGKTSPLCGNRKLFDVLQSISSGFGVDMRLMVGITYAESHIGVNFNPSHCNISNNRSGIKNSRLPTTDRKRNFVKGCRLHQFNSVEEFWTSFAIGLKKGYIDKKCSTPECISKYRVKNDGIVKNSRVNRVKLFY